MTVKKLVVTGFVGLMLATGISMPSFAGGHGHGHGHKHGHHDYRHDHGHHKKVIIVRDYGHAHHHGYGCGHAYRDQYGYHDVPRVYQTTSLAIRF